MIIILGLVLFLHFGFEVFQILTFAAYVGSVTESGFWEYLSITWLLVFAIIEGMFCWWLHAQGGVWFLWLAAGGMLALSLLMSFILAAFRRLDLSIWIPFCVVFSPVIILPILVFIWIFYDKVKGVDLPVDAESILMD